MKILVTGATGFIGRYLVSMLNETGHNVKALVRQGVRRSFVPSWMHRGTVKIVAGDVTNVADVKNAVKDVDVVFHLAALLGKWQVPESEYHRVNVYGTQMMIDQCLKFDVDYFVFLSTTGVMGRLKNFPADIDHPCSPMSNYEKSKYQAELGVREAIDRKDFPATIIRSTHTFGPGDKDFIRLFKAIKWLKVLPLIGGGLNFFQPIYVKDVARALIMCMEKSEVAVRRLYIIAGAESVRSKEFIHLSAKIMDTRLMSFDIPVRLAWAVANANESVGTMLSREPLLTASLVRFFTSNYLYNAKRICEDIGFTPKIDIKTGLSETIGWYKKHSWL